MNKAQFPSLRFLSLRGFIFDPPRSDALPQLTALRLEKLYLERYALPTMLSKCSNLRQLTLVGLPFPDAGYSLYGSPVDFPTPQSMRAFKAMCRLDALNSLTVCCADFHQLHHTVVALILLNIPLNSRVFLRVKTRAQGQRRRAVHGNAVNPDTSMLLDRMIALMACAPPMATQTRAVRIAMYADTCVIDLFQGPNHIMLEYDHLSVHPHFPPASDGNEDKSPHSVSDLKHVCSLLQDLLPVTWLGVYYFDRPTCQTETPEQWRALLANFRHLRTLTVYGPAEQAAGLETVINALQLQEGPQATTSIHTILDELRSSDESGGSSSTTAPIDSTLVCPELNEFRTRGFYVQDLDALDLEMTKLLCTRQDLQVTASLSGRELHWPGSDRMRMDPDKAGIG
ncbi:hypothetical protein C8Q76DRAFT_752239, partial [Earliella scabrosa]